MTNLKNIITNLDRFERYGGEYYNVVSLKRYLDDICSLEILQDITLIPFYLTPNNTYEIYDYELNIRIVKQSNRNNYFLSKTGKTSIEEIDEKILEKLNICYIEITKKKSSEATTQIKRYIEYLLNSPKVMERIPKELGEFKKENLYFDVYFY